MSRDWARDAQDAQPPDWGVVGGAVAAILAAVGGFFEVFRRHRNDREDKEQQQEEQEEKKLSDRTDQAIAATFRLIDQQRTDIERLTTENERLWKRQNEMQVEIERLHRENSDFRRRLSGLGGFPALDQ